MDTHNTQKTDNARNTENTGPEPLPEAPGEPRAPRDPNPPAPSPLDLFHVVLVESAHSLNVGGVARAMMNLGFRHLHLVAPVRYDLGMARVTARSASPLLDTLQTHPTLADAVADMEETIALALRPGRNPAHFATLRGWAEGLPARPLRKTALIFGPEDNGLRQEHLNLCRWVVRIPSTNAFDSFNLAQSVLLTLYEIANALPDTPLEVPEPLTRPATRRDHLLLDRSLESVLNRVGFRIRGPQPPDPGAVRNLLGRLELTTQEVGILLSLFGQVDKALRREREGQ